MVGHDVILRGLGGKETAPPMILQRTDENVVGVLLETLETANPYAAVAGSQARTRTTDGWLRLYQPVHRTFHIALLEVVCDRPGFPRLDPAKIDSAGIVIRRVHKARGRASFPQGWLSTGKKLRGWASLPKPGTPDYLRDPDPLRRKVVSAGAPELARMALEKARLEDGAEDVTDLFVVPPQVCERSGKTILFGLIPTVSSEMSETPAPTITAAAFDPQNGKDAFKDAVLPVYLKAGTGFSLGVLANQPASETDLGSGRTFTALSASNYTYLRGGIPTPIGSNPPTDSQKKQLDDFLDMLRFLRISVDAFGTTPEALAIQAELAKILLPANKQEAAEKKGRRADLALAEAAKALVAQEKDGPTSFTMPYAWPAVPKSTADEIYKQIKAAVAARITTLQPMVPRFEELSARYRLRAFVRVKRDDGCPPDLVWSDESEPYMIVPWYENGVLPPIQIQLPDIGPDFISSLKPNVAFKMPRRLFNFLNSNNPKDLMEGKGSGGVDIGLEWICSFNISIIFVLAFIVMFMFLIILNIIFWWLPFIRICFPLPTVSTRDDQ